MTKGRTYKTYSGNRPYAFFSYAHADSAKVLKVVDELDSRNYRLWYDAGIEAGVNWPEVVATHLLDSKTVLLFLTERFLRSQNCRRELNYAVAEKKRMYCIFLEDLKLPEDVAMQLSTVETLDGKDLDEKQISDRICEALGEEYIGDGIEGYEKSEKKDSSANRWRILSIILGITALLLGIALFGYLNNWFSFAGEKTDYVETKSGEKLEITKFKDKVSRNILIKAYDGTALYLCGDYMVSLNDSIRYRSGSWYIEDQLIEEADFGDLDALITKDQIISLALVNENIADAGKLAEMKGLKYLDISGNPLTDLSFLSELSDLEILKIINVQADDYQVLKKLEKLSMLYISEDMYEDITAIIDPSLVDIVVKK